MVVIFGFSGDTASMQHSSRIVEPLLRWLFPNMSRESLDEGVLIARKCCHLTEYAILAFLAWRAIRKLSRREAQPWLWSQACAALWIAMFYAATDEFHQTFVPTREGCLRDVLIDSSGAAAGLLVIWAFGRWRKHW
jgi:VanZ family protein